MLLRTFSYFLFLFMSFCMKGQIISVNKNTENLDLQQITKVYKTVNHQFSISQILQNNQLVFEPIQHLNSGITHTDYWVKFTLKNTEIHDLKLRLAFESMVNDSLFLYKVINQKVIETTILGEYLPFSASVSAVLKTRAISALI